MRKAWKKVCACILCATMVAGVKVPSTSKQDTIKVSAEEDHDGEFTYQNRRYQYKNIDSSNISLVRVLDAGGELSVPSTVTINGKKKTVTRLEYPFCGWQTYSKVHIPNTVKNIGSYVFYSSTIDKLQLSSNIETIDVCFAMYAKVNSVSCSSTKIKQIDGQPFYGATCPNKIKLGTWLVKYNLGSNVNTLDLTDSFFSNIDNALNGVFDFDQNVDTLKIGKNDKLFWHKYYKNLCCRYFKNIYLNGKLVKCTSKDDTVPKVIKEHYDFFDFSEFNIAYAKDKAKYVLNSLNLTYYGPYSAQKGYLTTYGQYNVCKKIHDYIVNNYTYDTSANGSFGKVFNCHTVTKCQYDSQLYAFLVECAGVDAETCFSCKLIPITAKEKEELMKTNPGAVTPDGKYKYGPGGNHCVNTVNIGGDLYFVDNTADRCNNIYSMFLVSTDTLEKGTKFGVQCAAHMNQIYSLYRKDDKWSLITDVYANRDICLQTPKCNKIHGGIDLNYYGGDESDVEKLTAFLCIGNSLREKCLKSTNGYVSLTDKEFECINNVTSGDKKVQMAVKENGKVKLLFNPKALDTNFDGKIDISDTVLLAQRTGKCLNK